MHAPMRHDSLLSYGAHRLKIRSHDVRYPAHLGITPQVVHRRALIVPGFTQGLERYVEADLVTEFKQSATVFAKLNTRT